jgi:patatin-like phospholipase/acyl hydrolase
MYEYVNYNNRPEIKLKFTKFLELILVTIKCDNIFVQAKLNDLKNARLADVCIGTSAAPTFLPAHYFETSTEDAEVNPRRFHLIDGGVAANNPVSSWILR